MGLVGQARGRVGLGRGDWARPRGRVGLDWRTGSGEGLDHFRARSAQARPNWPCRLTGRILKPALAHRSCCVSPIRHMV